jgi:hypothetical protein
MAMYRQADRYLVEEQALVLPIHYGGNHFVLKKPWVKNYQQTSQRVELLQNVFVEEH